MGAEGQPVLEVPRPAMALLGDVGYGHASLSLGDLLAASGRPASTVKGYIQALVDAGLVLHAGYDDYVVPRKARLGYLLLEPDPHRRAVLLHDEAFHLRGEHRWAFACHPIRAHVDVAFDRAIPVLAPDERLMSSSAAPYPDVAWLRVADDDIRTTGFVTAEDGINEVPVPTLDPRIGLAILMATLDPRFVQAAADAAESLGVGRENVVRVAEGFYPERPPIAAVHPNTLVLPAWLRGFWETAKHQHAHGMLRTLASSDEGRGAGRS